MQIFVAIKDTRHGPYSQEEFNAMRRSRGVSDYDLVWRDGMPEWRTVIEEMGAVQPPPLPRHETDGAEGWLHSFISVHDRNSRSTYSARCMTTLSLTLVASVGITYWAQQDHEPALFLLMVPVWVLAAVLFFINTIRRLHDISHEWPWALVMLIPLVNVAFIALLMIKEGDKGTNCHGYDPQHEPPAPKVKVL